MSIRSESASAEERFLQQWEPLAGHLARRFAGAAEREDLEQVARLALLNAKRRFDPGRGTRFSTYAVPTILGDLRRYVRDRGHVHHVPRRCWDLRARLRKAAEGMRQNLDREPTAAELSDALGIPEAEVARALGIQSLVYLESLDDTGEDLEGHRTEALSVQLGENDAGLQAVESRVAVRQAMQELPWRLREVLRRRYFAGQTQRQVGDALGLSQMQISRLERSALDELRNELGARRPNP
jgi:RNA polymerase sigma-B factor